MKEKQESHEEKPFVEPNLIKGEKLNEVIFHPAGYADPLREHHHRHHHINKIRI